MFRNSAATGGVSDALAAVAAAAAGLSSNTGSNVPITSIRNSNSNSNDMNLYALQRQQQQQQRSATSTMSDLLGSSRPTIVAAALEREREAIAMLQQRQALVSEILLKQQQQQQSRQIGHVSALLPSRPSTLMAPSLLSLGELQDHGLSSDPLLLANAVAVERQTELALRARQNALMDEAYQRGREEALLALVRAGGLPKPVPTPHQQQDQSVTQQLGLLQQQQQQQQQAAQQKQTAQQALLQLQSKTTGAVPARGAGPGSSPGSIAALSAALGIAVAPSPTTSRSSTIAPQPQAPGTTLSSLASIDARVAAATGQEDRRKAGGYNYFDASALSDPDPSALSNRRARGGVTEPFPEKLHRLLTDLEQSSMQDIASFFPHGRAFAIHNPTRFVSEVMPRYFRQSRLSSFQRQLNLYGFTRITSGPDSGGYYHELFLKGRPALCVHMRRVGVPQGSAKGQPTNPQSMEPDFYSMKPVTNGTGARLPVSASTKSNNKERRDQDIANRTAFGVAQLKRHQE